MLRNATRRLLESSELEEEELPRIAETLTMSSCADTTQAVGRAMPIYLPAGFVVRRFFTFFRPGNVATQWQCGLYDKTGARLAEMAVAPIAEGVVSAPALVPYVVPASDWYVMAWNRDGGNAAQTIQFTSGNVLQGGANLGTGNFPLPASISVGNAGIKIWCGVSEEEL